MTTDLATLDIRSAEAAFRQEYVTAALCAIESVCRELRVVPSIEKLSDSAPLERLPEEIQSAVANAAEGLGLSFVRMPSGAIHDCLYLGQQKQSSGRDVPVGMIFIPCRNGKSHCPEELSTFQQIAKGASALATAS